MFQAYIVILVFFYRLFLFGNIKDYIFKFVLIHFFT